MEYMETIGANAKAAAQHMSLYGSELKNKALQSIAASLRNNVSAILTANGADVVNAKKNGMSVSLLDRLSLTEQRIEGMVTAIMELIGSDDPIGVVAGGKVLPNGLSLVKRCVPLGVIGIIFESRPNVTVDAATLCLKSSNVCILRGSKDAINSNICLVKLMQDAIKSVGIDGNCIALVEDTSHDMANQMMKLNQYIDVLIPRGSGRLINTVKENSTIPVIETGQGNNHIYVDTYADFAMAVEIIDNAKTSRPSVCNAIETVLVEASIATLFLPLLAKRWNGKVAIYGDSEVSKIIAVTRATTEEDYATEFLSLTVAIHIVENLEEAVQHINRYGTKHSETIITNNIQNATKFQNEVDAACVYVNASPRFTDGGQFGMGAEIGIATGKLHVRGPMGLAELTTYKYQIMGNGQIRK